MSGIDWGVPVFIASVSASLLLLVHVPTWIKRWEVRRWERRLTATEESCPACLRPAEGADVRTLIEAERDGWRTLWRALAWVLVIGTVGSTVCAALGDQDGARLWALGSVLFAAGVYGRDAVAHRQLIVTAIRRACITAWERTPAGGDPHT